jgi:hypothetical protein
MKERDKRVVEMMIEQYLGFIQRERNNPEGSSTRIVESYEKTLKFLEDLRDEKIELQQIC